MRQRSVLIVSNSFDSHASEFIELAQKQGLQVLAFYTDKIGDQQAIQLQKDELQLKINGKWVDNSSIGAIWYRKPNLWWLELTNKYKELPDATKMLLEHKLGQSLSLLMSYLYQMESRDIPILPNPFINDTAHSKEQQLILAHKIGFNVPDTLITTDKKTTEAFIKKHGYNVIIKTLAAPSRHDFKVLPALFMTVKADRENFLLYLKSKAIAYPMIVQKAIEPKIDVRITCVGDKYFAATLTPKNREPNIDIRAHSDGDTVYKEIELEKSLKDKIKCYLKEMKLDYGAFDFVIDPLTSTFYFLEINPHGQYLFVEHETHQPITEALVDLFTAKSSA